MQHCRTGYPFGSRLASARSDWVQHSCHKYAGMKQIACLVGAGLTLAGCVSPYGWSEAPRDNGYYATPAPVDWWGRDAASVDAFFTALAPYGTWASHGRYGRVFVPGDVGVGWQPYARGYWRQDPRYGRLWVSSEPFGWATYHYGRWGLDSRLGWFWVPDTRFGPGWVDWQSGNGYASWAPLPPWGWNSWGYGYGNNWWVSAPSYWAWRPGNHYHVRPGRPGWDGGNGWQRPGQSDDRPDARPPRPPQYGGEGRHPRADPREPISGTHPRSTRMRSVEPDQTRHAIAQPRAVPAERPAPVRAEPARAETVRAEPVRAPSGVARSSAPRGRDVPANAQDQ